MARTLCHGHVFIVICITLNQTFFHSTINFRDLSARFYVTATATAKKNFVAIRQKFDFSDRREKKQNSISFSLAHGRVPKLLVAISICR